MNAVVRILLMINAAFLIALSVSLYGLLEQGREDVIREQQAMRPVVEALIQSGKAQEILGLIGTSLRHVRVLESQAGHLDRKALHNQPPGWFVALLDHPDRGYSLSLTHSGNHGESVTLVPDDRDEIAEVWDSAQQLFWLFMGSAVLSNLAIFWGVQAGIRPLGHILLALGNVKNGEFKTRLGRYAIPEVNAIALHFNTMAVALEKAEHENRRLTQTLMAVQEQERASLARELHDDLGQQVTGIRAQGYLIVLQKDRPEQLDHISENIVTACDAIDQGFRRIIHNLYPVQLEQLGLKAAVMDMMQLLESRTGLHCYLHDEESTWPDWSLEDTTHIYRLLQEALNNTVRHADASRVDVSLTRSCGYIVMTVSDDGVGLPTDKTMNANVGIRAEVNAGTGLGFGLGLRSMSERCRVLGGKLVLSERDVHCLGNNRQGSMRKGLCITVTLPDPDSVPLDTTIRIRTPVREDDDG